MNETGVFLSYAREDKDIAEKVLRALRSRGFPVFFDQHFPAGVEWKKAIETQLQRAYAVVVLWSSHCRSSNGKISAWIRREIAAGLAKDRLFPILIESGAKLPKSFNDIQVADLSDWNGKRNDPKFSRAIVLLEVLWDSQVGIRRPTKVLKPLRLRTRPASPSK